MNRFPMNAQNQSPPRDETRPVLEAEHLEKTFLDFWKRPRVKAVADLSFSAFPGEVLGLLGPNGSGKSTTIKMLLGLLRPTAGFVRLFGLAPDTPQARARIGYLPELSNLHKFLTPRETLDYYGGLFGLSAAKRRETIPSLLDRVGIARKDADRAIGEFSKGMARRVGLAQALRNNPELIILDEPTSGLDPVTSARIVNLIRDINVSRGVTSVVVTHDLDSALRIASRILLVKDGRAVICATPEDFVQSEAPEVVEFIAATKGQLT